MTEVEFKVTVNTDNNAPPLGSLRQAIIDINNYGGTAAFLKIVFEFVDDNATTIELVSGTGAGTLQISKTGIPIIIDGFIIGSDPPKKVEITTVTAFRAFIINTGVEITFRNIIIRDCLDGAIESNGSLTIENSEFDRNVASYVGGAIFSADGILSVTNSDFTGNSGVAGGAIFSANGTSSVTNSDFTSNSGNSPGGAIYIVDGILSVTNSDFTSNSGYLGGAIYTEDGILSVTNSDFTSNSGNIGGAICHNSELKNDITNNTFISNVAVEMSGAIFSGGSLTIESSFFDKNSSGYISGVIGVNDRSSTTFPKKINNSTFKSSSAVDEGGVIRNLSNMFIFNSTFYDNAVTGVDNDGGYGRGGAIINYNHLFASNCTFDTNTATSSDSGSIENDDTLRLVNCTITNGTPYGIYTPVDDATTSLGNTVVYNNGVFGPYTDLSADPNRPISNSVDGTDPDLGQLQDNGGTTFTRKPNNGSHLIDAGVDEIVTTYIPAPPPGQGYTDQRGPGFPRFSGSSVDIGAVEFQQVICFSGNSFVLTKEIETGEMTYTKAIDVYSNKHLVYSTTKNEFVPIKLNAITGPTARYMLITKDLLGEGKPIKDFKITSGHCIQFNDTKTKSRNIPGAKRINVESENVYTICTDEEEIINVNNLPVYTMAYSYWIDYTSKKRIHWRDNQPNK